MDQEFLTAPVNSAVDKFQLIPEFLKVRGLVKQHLDSFNYFVNTGIKKIVRANDHVEATRHPYIYLRFFNVKIGKPSIMKDGNSDLISPQTCRLSDRTYAAPITVDIEYTLGSPDNLRKETRPEVNIGSMPIMLRSCCCVLNNRDEDELAKLVECPLDPGGYFIIKGNEKHYCICYKQYRENKNKNYHFDGKGEDVVPLMVVMKAMGMEIDQEVVQLIGRDPRYSFLLMPSIEEYINCRVFTQAQALEYLDSKAKGPRFSNMAAEKDGRAFNILKNEFLANVPMHGDNFRPKCIYLAVMMRRIMDAILNKDAMDDKVCGACGLLGYYNHKLKAGTCSSCKNGKQISNVKVPYACKLLIQELQSMNIVPRLKLEDTKV